MAMKAGARAVLLRLVKEVIGEMLLCRLEDVLDVERSVPWLVGVHDEDLTC